MSLLIKNGRIITATDDYVADVFIDGETIKTIGKDLTVKADRTIDATAKLVIPGGIDPHVHMELPFGGTVSSDDFKTGTIAAAFGGTTSIIDFAIQYKGKTFKETLDDWDSRTARSARSITAITWPSPSTSRDIKKSSPRSSSAASRRSRFSWPIPACS